MKKCDPVPEEGRSYGFYANDQVTKDTEHEAKVLRVYTFDESGNKEVYVYNDIFERVESVPVMDLWIEEAMDLFWILEPQTDYIIELFIPTLIGGAVFAARDLDGGWHTFETTDEKQFGILDVTGKLHNKLHEGE